MNQQERDYVIVEIEQEGFDYCFREGSEFEDIKDKKFHELRKKYCEAADELDQYINKDE